MSISAPVTRAQPPEVLTPSRYAWLSALYILAYMSLNIATGATALRGSDITVWSPDNALSIILILRSTAFAPVVAVAQIVTDLFVSHVNYSFSVIFCSQLVLAFGYLAISVALRDIFGFRLDSANYPDRLAVLAAAPIGAALTGVLYCGSLTLLGVSPPGGFFAMFANFWIGDTAGIGVALPAAVGLVDTVARTRAGEAIKPRHVVLLAALGTVMVGLIFFSVSDIKRRYTFDLLFLPMLLVGLKFGYSAAALVLLFAQVALLTAFSYYHVNQQFFQSYQVMMFILAVSGQALGAAVTQWQDATRRLHRQQAELAELSAQAANSVLAAAMAHEISQPLASLNNYVHSARRVLENSQGVDVALAALRKAEAEAARARRIIERIRDFIAGGSLALEPVDLIGLSETIVRLNRDLATANGVELRCVFEAGRTVVDADRVALEQALNNLVVNAIEAIGDKGGEVVVRLTRSANALHLGVEDDGPGVSADLSERMFDVFETTKPRGMGLGLPLTKQIAERHGGRLSWRSRVPRGSRFEIELPPS